MRIFYYVHTGHRIGLDRFRRAATIIKALGDVDITLLCSDYRIAQIARDFGVKNSVGLDVLEIYRKSQIMAISLFLIQKKQIQ